MFDGYNLQETSDGLVLRRISQSCSYLMGEATCHNRIACEFAHVAARQLPNLDHTMKTTLFKSLFKMFTSPARQYYIPPSGAPWWSGTAGDHPLRLRCLVPWKLYYQTFRNIFLVVENILIKTIFSWCFARQTQMSTWQDSPAMGNDYSWGRGSCLRGGSWQSQSKTRWGLVEYFTWHR